MRVLVASFRSVGVHGLCLTVDLSYQVTGVFFISMSQLYLLMEFSERKISRLFFLHETHAIPSFVCVDGFGLVACSVDVSLEDAVELFIAADLYTLDRLKVRVQHAASARGLAC